MIFLISLNLGLEIDYLYYNKLGKRKILFLHLQSHISNAQLPMIKNFQNGSKYLFNSIGRNQFKFKFRPQSHKLVQRAVVIATLNLLIMEASARASALLDLKNSYVECRYFALLLLPSLLPTTNLKYSTKKKRVMERGDQ